MADINLLDKLDELSYKLETEGSEQTYDCLKELIYILYDYYEPEALANAGISRSKTT